MTVETLATFNDGTFDMKLRLTLGDTTGHFPDKIEQPLALVNHFHSPNRMRLAAVRGNSSVVQDLPPAPPDRERIRWNEFVLRYVRALMTIQRYVPVELRVPDLTTEEFDHMQGVLRAARLIDGEVVKVTWDGMRFTLPRNS